MNKLYSYLTTIMLIIAVSGMAIINEKESNETPQGSVDVVETTQPTFGEMEADAADSPIRKMCGYNTSLETLPSAYDNSNIYVPVELQEALYEMSFECGVPYTLTLAVCAVESSFDSGADNAGMNNNGTTDYGLMGINSAYVDYYEDIYDCPNADLYDALDNAYIGINILSDLLSYYDGDIYDTACAYNLGQSGWDSMKSTGQSWYYGDMVTEYIAAIEPIIKY